MAETKIEWTARYLPDGRIIPGYTFNPWKGCTHAGPDCLHCYAEALMDNRWRQVEWGPRGERKRTTPAYWMQPAKWNRIAENDGIKRFVFCASLADILDDHPSIQSEWRRELLQVVHDTPNLIWLMLTKRPQNYEKLISLSRLPRNVWLGTSAGTQKMAEKRIPKLLEVPAVKHFVSIEPLIEPVNIMRWLNRLDWVIAGGESGTQARPVHPSAFESLRDDCEGMCVPFFFKQWGEWYPCDDYTTDESGWHHLYIDGKHVKASQEISLPLDRMRAAQMFKVGKHKSGNTLFGQKYLQQPAVD